MSEPKKANLFNYKKTAPGNAIGANNPKPEERVNTLLKKYEAREEEYAQVGEQRATEDKKRKEERDSQNKGYIRTSFFLSHNDNEEYEVIRRKTKGALRRYRHILSFGLKNLSKMNQDEIIKQMLEVDNEYNKTGIVIKK